MDLVRAALLLALTAVPATASPVDTADDFLRAVEWRDGEAVLETLSSSLRATLEARWAEFGAVAQIHPELAGAVLSRTLPYLSPSDLAGMSLAEFLSQLMPTLDLTGYEAAMVERMDLDMTGRYADVTMHWPDGRSAYLAMVWEESSWRITGSDFLDSILDDLF